MFTAYPSTLKVCAGMVDKVFALSLGDYIYMNVAESVWKKLLWWIRHSLIPEMIQVGKDHTHLFWGYTEYHATKNKQRNVKSLYRGNKPS
jgi:hypothetical protein